MSDEMKNCCPPETTAPKMEVHDASEGSKDIKPKMISTAHKQLSKDEFQRKIAMAAYSKAADDMGLSDMEKEAFMGALLRPALMLGRAALKGGLPRFGQAVSSLAARAGTQGKTWSNLLPRALQSAGNSKLLAPLTAGSGQANTWMNLPTRLMFGNKGLGSALALPITHPGYAALTAAPFAGQALPYVGGALQRAGQALGGTVGMGGGGGSQGGLSGGLMNGGLLGAGIGAVGGALMPGQEEYEDEDGRIRKRSRGMFAGALRGAGMGGLAGAGIGAGMDYMGKMSSAQDFGAAIANLQKQAMDPAQMKAMMHGSLSGSGAAVPPAPRPTRRPATPAMSPAIQKGLLAGGAARPQTPQASPFAR